LTFRQLFFVLLDAFAFLLFMAGVCMGVFHFLPGAYEAMPLDSNAAWPIAIFGEALARFIAGCLFLTIPSAFLGLASYFLKRLEAKRETGVGLRRQELLRWGGEALESFIDRLEAADGDEAGVRETLSQAKVFLWPSAIGPYRRWMDSFLGAWNGEQPPRIGAGELPEDRQIREPWPSIFIVMLLLFAFFWFLWGLFTTAMVSWYGEVPSLRLVTTPALLWLGLAGCWALSLDLVFVAWQISRLRKQHRLKLAEEEAEAELRGRRHTEALLARAKTWVGSSRLPLASRLVVASLTMIDAISARRLMDGLFESGCLSGPTALILRGARLRSVDLSGWQAEGVCLAGVDMAGVVLTGACLDRARLDECNLQGASMQKASLRSASLRLANLARVQAQQACFREANLSGAILDGANLWGAELPGIQSGTAT
jgi:uncharacterized protein YjbI with pentapeptide repeats